MSNLSVREILQKCSVSQQFNDAFCNNLSFWKQLAAKRGLPAQQIDNATIAQLKQHLRRREEWYPMLFDLNKWIYPDYSSLKRYPPLSLSTFSSGGNYDILSRSFERLIHDYRHSIRVAPYESPRTFTTIENFTQRLNDLRNELQVGDVLFVRSGTGMPTYAIVLTDPRGNLILSSPWNDNNFRIEHLPILQRIYELNKGKPLTYEIINKMYLDRQLDFPGIYDAVHRLWRFGDENDPVTLLGGVEFHYVPNE